VNDANALAKETREEADRLQKEAEDAELKAASAASMKEVQPREPATNGYPSAAETKVPYMGAASSSPMGAGFGGQPMSMMVNTDYNPSVMGGGGIEIPTPGDDPYDNPFSS
jgi:hypothetical protein